jgi:hypothetical protein
LNNKKNSNNYFPSHLIFYYGYSMTHKSRLFVHFRSYPNLFSELVLNWCWRRKWLLDQKKVSRRIIFSCSTAKSWIDNDEKKRNPFEMIYNARMFHWRRGTLTARHYNLSSDNDDDDDDNGRWWNEAMASHRRGMKKKKANEPVKGASAVHALAHITQSSPSSLNCVNNTIIARSTAVYWVWGRVRRGYPSFKWSTSMAHPWPGQFSMPSSFPIDFR